MKVHFELVNRKSLKNRCNLLKRLMNVLKILKTQRKN